MDIPRIFTITESAHRIHNPITAMPPAMSRTRRPMWPPRLRRRGDGPGRPGRLGSI